MARNPNIQALVIGAATQDQDNFRLAFQEAMAERVVENVARVRNETAKTLLEDENKDDDTVSQEMQEAVEYVIDSMTENGIDDLPGAIQRAADAFGINEEEIAEFFEALIFEAAEEVDEESSDVKENLVNPLMSAVQYNTDTLVEFPNNTAQRVTVEDARKILNLFVSLNEDNQQKLYDKALSNIGQFRFMLKLAEEADQTITEKYMGFEKLKSSLSHKKGVSNPAGLAAAIGRKKYGSKGFSTHKHKGEN